MKSQVMRVVPEADSISGEEILPPLENQSSKGCRDDDPCPRILLIAQTGEARDLYTRTIRQTGAHVDTVALIEDFQGAVAKSAYNGIVIDIPTKIQALNRHQDLVSSILDRFPVIQVNQEKTTGRIRALLYGRHQRQGELRDLIREACLSEPPRRFRAAERRDIKFNLLLSRSRHFESGVIERTVTINISQGGCFVFTTSRFQKGQRVWIRIMEFYDKSPIACVVIHKRKWGQEMAIPGIGVRFESLTDAQARALAGRWEPPHGPERTAGKP